ncbi:hypothetical protein Tco_0232886 [Tanacetum coccineum]
MGDANPIRTLRDYSKPSHEGYRNTIKLPVGKNVVPLRSETIQLVQKGCSLHGLWKDCKTSQRYIDVPTTSMRISLKSMDSFQGLTPKSPSSWHRSLALRLMSNFMASQEARLSKFEDDFKQQQSEMTNKINTVLKAITYRMAGALPSDMVKNLKLNTSPVSSVRSYPNN